VRLFAISLLLCSILTGCWKQPSRYNWSNAPGTEQYERLMWQAIRDKDWTEVERHLAPAFVGSDARGRSYDRAAWIEHWKATQIRDFSLGEVAVQPDGADMVVTYEVRLNGEESGQPLLSAPVRMVSVWQQLKKGWILIAQSGTPVTGSPTQNTH
jgi:ketosteroid isomerase-like protein